MSCHQRFPSSSLAVREGGRGWWCASSEGGRQPITTADSSRSAQERGVGVSVWVCLCGCVCLYVGGAVKALMRAPCVRQAFPFVVPEPEGLWLGRSQGSRYTTFLSHYSRRLFRNSTIPRFHPAFPSTPPVFSSLSIFFGYKLRQKMMICQKTMVRKGAGRSLRGLERVEGLLLLQSMHACVFKFECLAHHS